MRSVKNALKAGWAEVDITPEGKVYVLGQHYARVSEGVADPVTSTALAFESESGEHAVMVSCDLAGISDELRDGLRNAVGAELPGLDPENVFLSATHTHAAPHMRSVERHFTGREKPRPVSNPYGIELDAMAPAEYVDFAVKKIAGAVKRAWDSRKPSGIGYGMGHAVVGRNRRLIYSGGEGRMYGKASDPGFIHVEGYEDHSVYVMGVYGENGLLSGMVVNVPCPAQVSEHSYKISADYWHEAREEIRKRFGKNLFVLAQCAPAGDQSPHVLINNRAEERMWRLKERDVSQNAPRQEIAEKIAGAVGDVLPAAKKEIDWNPAFGFRRKLAELPRRQITEKDVKEAEVQSEKHREKYEELLSEIQQNPAVKKEPRWYKPVTYEYARMRWFKNVARRFEIQQENPVMPVELNFLRLGDIAFATNPFELYLDYGTRMRELSASVQTFLVQLAGSGAGYLPSARSIACGGYGSVPASTNVGPEGGEVLVGETVKTINLMMEARGASRHV